MNKIKMNFIQGALRTGLFLCLLANATPIVAQSEETEEPVTEEAPASRPPKSPQPPKYKMMEVTGHIFDAATKRPLGGVTVQALGNRQYTTITDDSGAYTLQVPVFVNSMYVFLADYNATQLALKGTSGQNTVLYRGLVKEYYQDGTPLTFSEKMKIETPSALTVENEVENKLNAAVRTISRGGMPAQGTVMLINGINSLNANSQPLVVVDGVVWDMQYDRTGLHEGFFNNVLNNIDPEDIENVEVLTNGTSLYGAKGSNGVLLITTKRGKSMVTRINIRAYGGFETTPSRISVMNEDQFRNYVTEFLGTTTSGEKLSSATAIPFLNENPDYLFYDMYHNNNTDWQKDLYATAFTQNYKVSVEGGDDIAKYNLSLGYSKSEATAKKNDFNRLNIRFNTDINMFKNFTTALDIAYSHNAYNLRDNGWASDYSSSNISSPNVLGLLQSPFVSQYYRFVYYDDATGTLKSGFSNSVYAGKVYSDSNNPLAFASSLGYAGLANPYWILLNGEGDNKNYQEQTMFSLNVAPKYQINRNLTISNRFSYLLNRTNEKYYLPYNGTPSIEVEGLGAVQSVIRTQFGKETTLFNDLRLDWRKDFGEHNLHIFGGFRYSGYTYKSTYIAGYNNDNDKMPNMSYSLQYKQYGGVSDNWTNIAWYADANYNYKNKYFVDVTATMEASSRFGKEAADGLKLFGVQWGFFPSIQAGWLISSEDWFKVKAIDYLKLTAGIDVSGNDDVDYYASRTYFQNIKFLDKATALVLGNIENPEIQWETTTRYSIGFKAGLLQNRLHVGANYYYSKTNDLLTRKSISDITGMTYNWTNDGTLTNKGVNVNTDAILLNTKNWKWQAGFSIGHYKNEITALSSTALNTITTYALDENGQNIESTAQSFSGYTSNIYGKNNILTAVGHAAGVFYGYATQGVFSTDAEASQAGAYGYLRYPTGISEQPYRNFKAGDVHFVDQNGDGWISAADMVVIGDPNPDIFGNFYTSLTWKNLQLDVNFKYSVGNDVYNYQRSQLESGNNTWNQTTAMVNRWRYEGQVTDVPRTMAATNEEWVNNERFSDRWIEDGSYLKLKRVRLTYKLPLNLSWLQGFSVWGEANNVFTVTKYLGTDPEVTAGNGVLYQGIDAGRLSTGRNFNLGVTINL